MTETVIYPSEERAVQPLHEHTTEVVQAYLLNNLTEAEWNEAMYACREEMGENWGPTPNGTLVTTPLCDRDLVNINMNLLSVGTNSFVRCKLNGSYIQKPECVLRFYECDLTDSNLSSLDSCHHTFFDCINAPLPDVTSGFAMHFLREAVRDEQSFIHEGLSEIASSGVSYRWDGYELKFWLMSEVERHIDYCEEGECECEIEHECQGSCECCPCASRSCECEPSHDHYTEAVGDIYLATFIGKITYRWNDRKRSIEANMYAVDGTKHPHVSRDLSICWGDAQSIDSLKPADHMLRVIGWIGQHNPSSEYRSIYDLPQIA